MAENLIFNEPELAFADLGNGLFAWQSDTVIIPLAAGETYIVEWDSTRHTCEAVSTVFDDSDVVVIGNFGIVGAGESNGMPFLMGSTLAGDLSLCYTADTDEANAVAIYHVTEEETGGDSGDEETGNTDGEAQEGIILKDRKGNDVPHYGIETLTVDTTTEGKQQVYSKGVAVEGLEIVLDFTGGDMPLSAGEDTLVKSAVIRKPDDLSQENVRRGKTIAGIDGDFIGDLEELIIGEAEGETQLNFAEVDQVTFTPSTDDKVFSQVTVKKPEMLLPENIAKDVEIAGVVGTFKGGGLEETMRYFQCHIDPTAGTITLYKIYYDLIYADTGSYDVVIPDTLGGLNVIISATS